MWWAWSGFSEAFFSCLIQKVEIILVDGEDLRTVIELGKDWGSTKEWEFDLDYSGFRYPDDFTPQKLEVNYKKATVKALI